MFEFLSVFLCVNGHFPSFFFQFFLVSFYWRVLFNVGFNPPPPCPPSFPERCGGRGVVVVTSHVTLISSGVVSFSIDGLLFL